MLLFLRERRWRASFLYDFNAATMFLLTSLFVKLKLNTEWLPLMIVFRVSPEYIFWCSVVFVSKQVLAETEETSDYAKQIRFLSLEYAVVFCCWFSMCCSPYCAATPCLLLHKAIVPAAMFSLLVDNAFKLLFLSRCTWMGEILKCCCCNLFGSMI